MTPAVHPLLTPGREVPIFPILSTLSSSAPLNLMSTSVSFHAASSSVDNRFDWLLSRTLGRMLSGSAFLVSSRDVF